jgi:DNA polymerase III epsilon subunit-like protein
MRFLVFDTETSGLPKTKIISPDTLKLWPNIVQFSYVIYDLSLNDIIKTKNYIIKIPKDISLEESSKIHGITNEISETQGIELIKAFDEFFDDLKEVNNLVGHNIEFDINMIKVELMRIINERLVNQEKVNVCKHYLYYLTNYKNICCTLKDTVELCNIQLINKQGKPYLKFPKLSELHEKLFNKTPTNLHNSFIDILVTLRCLIKIKHNFDLNDNCTAFQLLLKELRFI